MQNGAFIVKCKGVGVLSKRHADCNRLDKVGGRSDTTKSGTPLLNIKALLRKGGCG